MPVTPDSAAGWRIEPPVSVPVAAGASRAATAAAEPPDDPPGTRARSQGFLTGPYQLVSLDEPIANSSMFVLPSVTTPAPLRRSTTVASYGDSKLSSMRDPQDVFTPLVQKMSLWASGMPVSVAAVPAAGRRAASAACSSASSPVTVLNAGSPSSSFAIRARQRRASSRADILRARSAWASCAIVRSCMKRWLLRREKNGVENGVRHLFRAPAHAVPGYGNRKRCLTPFSTPFFGAPAAPGNGH